MGFFVHFLVAGGFGGYLRGITQRLDIQPVEVGIISVLGTLQLLGTTPRRKA